MTQTNPYMVPGARVRCVDHANCPEMIIEGREYAVRAVAPNEPFVMTTDIPAWLHASRFKPVVRVKMRRCHVHMHSACGQNPCARCRWPEGFMT